MTVWIVIGIILLILFLISLLRVGGMVEYSADGLTAKARVGPLRITLYPRPRKEKKESTKEQTEQKKTKKTEAKEEKPPEEPTKETKKGGKLSLILRLIPVACEAAGRFRRKLRIDRLDIDFTAAGGADAAKGAIQFGQVSAAMGAMTALIENSFQVKERRFRSNVDFTLTEPVVYLYAALSITIGQCVCLGIWAGIRVLKVFLAYRKEQKKQAVKAVPAAEGKE